MYSFLTNLYIFAHVSSLLRTVVVDLQLCRTRINVSLRHGVTWRSEAKPHHVSLTQRTDANYVIFARLMSNPGTVVHGYATSKQIQMKFNITINETIITRNLSLAWTITVERFGVNTLCNRTKKMLYVKRHAVAQVVEALRYKAHGGAVGWGTALQGTRWRSWLRHCATRHVVAQLVEALRYKAHVGAVGWGTALQVGRSRVRLPMVSLECFIDIILPAALWPCGWLSL